MCHKALFNTQHRVLLIAGLIGSCLLAGCESESAFARFYKPASANCAPLAVAAATRLLAWANNPVAAANLLRKEGFVLLGTSLFVWGEPRVARSGAR